MTNGARNLNAATESEKTLAVALIGLAGAVFAGLLAALNGLLAGLSHNGAVWATVDGILILALLAYSMIIGGRGYAYGPGRADWRDRFNLQAISGALALGLVLVLAAIVYVTAEPSPNEKFAGDIASLKSDLTALKNELGSLRDKDGAFETSVGGTLSDVGKSLQSLSQRIEKLEAGAKQPKP